MQPIRMQLQEQDEQNAGLEITRDKEQQKGSCLFLLAAAVFHIVKKLT